jgi:glycosyltransferase involved in cell wall biosynthesis
MLGVVHNGIDLERLPWLSTALASKDYLLWLGRICEEKAPHVALDVSEASGLPLAMAGRVYPFSYHQRYFEREVVRRLGRNSQATFIESPTFWVKLDLLQRARALLITSLIEETSSLVGMEAAACGTPVVAFRRGALPEIVANGRTGFLVDSADEMLQALGRLDEIDARACREHVERNFSAARMADDYERIYRRVLQDATQFQRELRAA